jgi:HTH-type transcriptional regulator / antitoxin HigA
MTDLVSSQPFEPEWAVPPGATIAALLAARSQSRESFAAALGENVEAVQRLLLGLKAVDDDLATRLSMCLGSTKAFWVARESQYRADSARLRAREAEHARERWVKQFPAREMVKLGWIADFGTRAEAATECLKFFGVPDVAAWTARYAGGTTTAAFRMSSASKSNPGAATAWLRWAELIAERTPCSAWKARAFEERLQVIRRLTWQKDPATFLPKLRRLCAEVGVAVVVARTPKGCPANGATRFLSSNKALMVLSFRYRSDDQFWFTFFHEAAHLLFHGPDALFLEDDGQITSEEEREANEFAAAVLVPDDRMDELLSLRLDNEAILRFARQIGIAPGLVVGQLQHQNRVGPDRMNWLKRRYDWDQIKADRLIP